MSTDRSPETPRLSRREWMKIVGSAAATTALVPAQAFGAWGAVSATSGGPAPGSLSSPGKLTSAPPGIAERYPPEWTGHNRRLSKTTAPSSPS
ncbi:MAG: hypothetical protein P8174_06880, partial [Gemmatimonadota bacterium]